jgi:glycine betaine catabolism B
MKKFALTLDKKQPLREDTTAFYFAKPHAFSFIAGQYLQLILPHDADERGTARFFSITSSPEEEFIMITIKKGKSSFKKRLFAMEPKATIDAFGPMGKFTLED